MLFLCGMCLPSQPSAYVGLRVFTCVHAYGFACMCVCVHMYVHALYMCTYMIHVHVGKLYIVYDYWSGLVQMMEKNILIVL